MALRLFRETPDEASDFAKAKARWELVSARRRELNDKLAGARAAHAVLSNPPQKGDNPSPVLAEKARVYLAGRFPNLQILANEIIALDDQLIQAGGDYATEAAAWRAAVAAESAR